MALTEVEKEIADYDSDVAKLEFYRLIGEGYKAMEEGRGSTLEEVKERIKKRRDSKILHIELILLVGLRLCAL